MPYLTPAQLEDATSARELAQVASPQDARPCTAETLRTAIAGGDISSAPDGPAAAAALDRIVAMIDNAGDLVDNFLRGRYQLPLADPPPSTIAEIMVRVSRFLLHKDRATKDIQWRYEEAMQWLADIRDGTIVLDVPPDSAVYDGPDVCAPAPIYTVAGLEGFARAWP